MKAIVVDDEKLAARQLANMLRQTGAFEAVQTYTDPEKARDDAAVHPPDAAFLDIEMPEISGIELAEALQSANEQTQVVFTTAYDEFAIQAFELNAVDYLLKPMLKDRLEKAVKRVMKNLETLHGRSGTWKDSFGIECFDSLKFYRIADGRKIYIPVKWRTSRARELYAYLLQEHDRFVSRDTLIELLWPNIDSSKGTTQLYTTIYQIRKLMENLPLQQHIIKNDIGYSLTLSGMPIDVETWEKELTRLPALDMNHYKEHMDLFKAYKNHYFAEYGYLWAESERARLCRLWLEHAYRLIDFLIRKKNYTQALDICQQIDRIEPGHERNMKYELALYNKTGNVEGAIRVYESYRESKNAMN